MRRWFRHRGSSQRGGVPSTHSRAFRFTWLVFRELLQGTDDPNEGISLTLWESREDLDAYEQSDLYKTLVDHARAYYVGEFWVKHFEVRLGEARKHRQTDGTPEEGLGGWQSPPE
jgi:Antibiotic biosynthesis monooxygenase